MRFKSRNPRATIVGLIGTVGTAVWRGYSAITTAEQVPKDLQRMSHILADPGFWPWLFMAGFLLLLGWSLWPHEEDADILPVPNINARTSGSGSHAIGQMRDMIVNQSAAPIQHAKATGEEPSRETAKRVPRLPMWQALETVAKAIGDHDTNHCFPDARRQMRQAAVIGHVVIWGRKELPPEHMQSAEECVEIWTPIEPGYWQDWRITEMALGPLHDDRPHTAAEQHISTGLLSGRYWSLRTDEQELLAEWQEDQTQIAKNRVATKIPKRDATLAAGLAYALTGSWSSPVLETLLNEENLDGFNFRKREFEREAKQDRLTVWGRHRLMDVFSDQFWDIIEPDFWERNRVSWDNMILGDTAKTESRSGHGNADQYEDLMISKDEFEKMWPCGK